MAACLTNMLTFFSQTSTADAETVAAMAIFYGIVGVIGLISYIITSFFASTFFIKIGEPAWKAWVPVYANFVFLTRGGVNGAFAFLSLATWIPLLGPLAAIGLIIALAYAAVKYGKDFTVPGPGYVALYLLVTPVWFGILGLGKAVYAPAAIAGPLAGPTTEPGTPYTAR